MPSVQVSEGQRVQFSNVIRNFIIVAVNLTQNFSSLFELQHIRSQER